MTRMAKRTKQKELKVPNSFTPKFIEDLDHRYGIAKVLRQRYEVLCDDCQANSTQRDMLARRAVFMGVCLETQEHEAIETGELDVGKYTQMVNSLIGLLRTLGLEKKVKKAEDLNEYLKARA